jgi:hypothetical protein
MLKALGHQEDPQTQMSDSQVMTTAIVAGLYFGGNFERARSLLSSSRYIPKMLSKSQFNRRLHRISGLFLQVFYLLGETFKQINSSSVYVIDSFPISVCDNIRIKRSKVYKGEKYRGYIASKKRYFYGLKIFLMVTAKGEPVEMFLVPGSVADVSALDAFGFDLPEGSTVYGDSAFTIYDLEDVLKEAACISLEPIRKKNSKRKFEGWTRYLQACGRKIVETSGSMIERLLPKSIHAVTKEGFELKVLLFVLASSFSFAF